MHQGIFLFLIFIIIISLKLFFLIIIILNIFYRQGYYVLARHGKSRHLACWPLRDLIESNGNLEEEGTARHAGGYVIPKGGVGGQRGLRSRALSLHPYI